MSATARSTPKRRAAPERTSSAWAARVLHPHRVATLGEVPAALERMFRRP
jgi:hypothetical protein